MKILPFAFLLLAPTTALAASPAPAASSGSLIFPLLRLIGALAIVLALFLGGIHFLKNWQRLSLKKGGGAKLRVIEGRSLAPRQALYVVAYEDRRFLVGSSPAGISMLATLPDALGQPEEAPPSLDASFAQALLRAVNLR